MISILPILLPVLASQAHPWPFDFDLSATADSAAVQSRLDELGQGLPGLPAQDLSSVQLDAATLYFF